MNKNKISKIIVLIITFALIACLSTTVFAEDPVDLSNSLSGGNNTTGNGTTGNNTTVDNTTENQVPDITPNTTTPTNTNTNSSTYEESEIPHAGVESSILMVVAFVICGIIGIYTFIKLSDYSNI